MASLNEMPVMKGRRAGVRRMKKHDLKTDMTPMVDLGFLLIAFFVITTKLSEPAALNLVMPHDGPGTLLGDSNALTVLLDGDDKIWYYHGNLPDAVKHKQILPTNFSVKDGVGNIIRQKQRWLDQVSISDEKREGLMLLIKATGKAKYDNIISVLDEALINNVSKYAIVKIQPEEMKWLNDHQ
jgi:biopolymer transport protein ExbD